MLAAKRWMYFVQDDMRRKKGDIVMMAVEDS